MKRSGDNGQLSKEEYEAMGEEDEEDAGVYKKASAEVMATRKIVKRSHKFAKYGNQNVDPADALQPSSAFNSLNTKPVAAASKSNVFGSINLMKKTDATSKPSNVFSNVNLTKKSEKSLLGNTFRTSKSKRDDDDDDEKIGIVKTPSYGMSKLTKNNAGSQNDSSQTPATKMQKLNKAFMSWMEKQVVNHSVSNWTAGLQDYIKHAEKITTTETSLDVEGKDKPPSSSLSSLASNSSLPKFAGFGKPNGNQFKTSTAIKEETTKSTSDGVKKSGFVGFKSTAPVKTEGTVGFGGAKSISSSFATAPKSNSIVTNKTAPEKNEEYEGEPILEPEKIYKNESDKNEILYETDCKAFRFDTEGKEWKECGKGSLRMIQEPGEDKKKILVRNTLGKITINSYIFKGMGFKKVGKSGIQFLAVVDASGVPQSFLVKVRLADIQAAFDTFSNAEKGAK